jgi:transcriptional regulator of acetoin/glycerol metabolism
MLAEHFWRDCTQDLEGTLPEPVRASLLLHDWPGNVRELRNFIERAAATTDEALLAPPRERPLTYKEAKERAVDAFERSYLAELVTSAKGNVSEAARLAATDRVYLAKLLRKHGLHRTKAGG